MQQKKLAVEQRLIQEDITCNPVYEDDLTVNYPAYIPYGYEMDSLVNHDGNADITVEEALAADEGYQEQKKRFEKFTKSSDKT